MGIKERKKKERNAYWKRQQRFSSVSVFLVDVDESSSEFQEKR